MFRVLVIFASLYQIKTIDFFEVNVLVIGKNFIFDKIQYEKEHICV